MSGDDGEPRPRLCHLIKRDNFNGFGFNLHAEKSRPGQFVGVIDDGSPAEAAGLKEGDRIVEVNGVNISMENHKQVVSRIKAVPDETKLLVVDREADDYYRRKDCVVRGSMPNVLYLTSNREVGGPSAAVGGGPSGNGHHHHHVVVGEEDLREVQEGRGQINRDRLSSGGNSVSSGKLEEALQEEASNEISSSKETSKESETVVGANDEAVIIKINNEIPEIVVEAEVEPETSGTESDDDDDDPEPAEAKPREVRPDGGLETKAAADKMIIHEVIATDGPEDDDGQASGKVLRGPPDAHDQVQVVHDAAKVAKPSLPIPEEIIHLQEETQVCPPEPVVGPKEAPEVVVDIAGLSTVQSSGSLDGGKKMDPDQDVKGRKEPEENYEEERLPTPPPTPGPRADDVKEKSSNASDVGSVRQARSLSQEHEDTITVVAQSSEVNHHNNHQSHLQYHVVSGGSGRNSTPAAAEVPDGAVASSNWDGLNLNMSAKEMRERLNSRKKKDPRISETKMDFRKKSTDIRHRMVCAQEMCRLSIRALRAWQPPVPFLFFATVSGVALLLLLLLPETKGKPLPTTMQESMDLARNHSHL